MNIKFLLVVFSFCVLKLDWISGTDEVDDFEEDVPVIEGNGGVITTAVEDDVLILTRENFDLQVHSKDIILVEFYAPWCGHCKSLAPEYAKAAKILKEEDPAIPLAKVDATLETELASRYEVTGYPTLFIFKKGEKIPYEGPRSAMGIVEYMKERSDPNWKPPPTAVLTLTSENFTKVVEEANIILVEFYAPWCGHCKQLAPEYERAAKLLKDASIPLAKVDGTVEKDLADRYEAKGWPTLMLFRRGKKFPYEGPRNEPGIVSYMKEQARPPSREIRSAKEVQDWLGKTDPVVVGFFSDQGPFYQSFQEAGNMLRGKFVFLHSFSEGVMRQLGVEKTSVVLFQPHIYATDYEPGRFILDNAEASAVEMSEFVRAHCLPLVGERSRASGWKYENRRPLVVVYYDVDFSFDYRAETQRVRKQVAEVAREYKGRITFAVSREEDYQEELAELGLAESGEDVNVGFFQSPTERYRMEPTDEFSAQHLRDFVQGVLDGAVKRHIRSQPVPKDTTSPVLTLVGSTFDELVTRGDKDVLVEFYAPWCGHCKKLEPVYRKLAKSFAGHEKVVIAKIDATANDYPGVFSVGGFPTIYYVAAVDKEHPRLYEGDRTLDDLTRFVRNQLASSKDEL